MSQSREKIEIEVGDAHYYDHLKPVIKFIHTMGELLPFNPRLLFLVGHFVAICPAFSASRLIAANLL